MANDSLHEENLSAAALDVHRAVRSIMEELEAVDWYNQRAEKATDPELAAILRHNRDEEKEHAAMLMEWLRRHDNKFDEELHTYLFVDGSIMDAEESSEGH